MKKKKKNQSRKSITAVGAVFAAGLTPGIVTGSPVPEPLNTDIELTAADVVSIDGEKFDFEDLFAMNQADPVPVDQVVVVYGPPGSMKGLNKDKNKEKKKNKDKKKKKNKDQEIREWQNTDSAAMAEQRRIQEMNELKAAREKARRDSIERAMQQNYKLVYGPPPPKYNSLDPEQVRLELAEYSKDEAIAYVENQIMAYLDYISDMDRRFGNSGRPRINSKTELDSDDKTRLIEEVEHSFGVQVTEEMMEHLNTPNRLALFIVEVIRPADK